MFIVETAFPIQRKQKLYTVNSRLVPCEPGWNREATRINTFFHRHARDRISYNVTNKRQFTRHDDYEREFYQYPWMEYETVETLDAFFERVGFDYLTKTWRDPEEKCVKRKRR